MTRPITYKRLKNIALFYLERYDTTAEKLKTVLLRRIQKNIPQDEPIPAEVYQWIQQIVSDCQNFGYVNDSRYAGNLVRHLTEQGKSTRFIRQKLSMAGVDEQIIQAVLTSCNDYESAQIFARKRRLGTDYQKDMAKLARAGFSYEIAKKVLNKEEC